MQSKLDMLKSRILSKESKATINTEFYFLAKELGCLSDLLGREYEVIYEGNKIVKIIQKPMPIPTFVSMMNELEGDYKRQEKEARKMKTKGRKR